MPETQDRPAAAMIDVHTHVVPRVLPFEGRGDDLPRVTTTNGEHVVHVQGQPFRRISPVAWDLDARIEEMDRDGVAVQVLSPMPDLYGYWDTDHARAGGFCTAFNGWLAEAVGRHPDRFRGFGILPLQDPDRAAAAVAEVRASGLHGIAIGSNVEGRLLHEPAHREVIAEAARHELPIFVHAYRPPTRTRFTRGLDANACTFPTDVGLALMGLLVEGVFADHPRLQWMFSHGGGSALVSIPRLVALRAMAGGEEDASAQIAAQLAGVHVDLLVYSSALLHLTLDTFGSGRVVVGSDYPFLPDPTGAILADAGLPAEVVAGIRSANAASLLGM